MLSYQRSRNSTEDSGAFPDNDGVKGAKVLFPLDPPPRPLWRLMRQKEKRARRRRAAETGGDGGAPGGGTMRAISLCDAHICWSWGSTPSLPRHRSLCCHHFLRLLPPPQVIGSSRRLLLCVSCSSPSNLSVLCH